MRNASAQSRPLDLVHDRSAMLHLADISDLGPPHMADWPYRLSSPALHNPRNTRGWFDAANNLVAWAAMQTPFWAVDALVSPTEPQQTYKLLLTWARDRAAEMQREGVGRPIWFISITETATHQRAILEECGFSDQAHVAENPWSKVLFVLPPEVDVSPPNLPPGMTIRPIHAGTELASYVDLHRAAFNSDSMTVSWRIEVTSDRGYSNDLDLVLCDAAAGLIGFCITWLRHRATGEPVGQIEPIGLHHAFRGRRLSRQLMTEAVSRLRAAGAHQIFVECNRQNAAGMAAYQAMGFRVIHQIHVHRYDVPSV